MTKPLLTVTMHRDADAFSNAGRVAHYRAETTEVTGTLAISMDALSMPPPTTIVALITTPAIAAAPNDTSDAPLHPPKSTARARRR
jgi:hypothetical protein